MLPPEDKGWSSRQRTTHAERMANLDAMEKDIIAVRKRQMAGQGEFVQYTIFASGIKNGRHAEYTQKNNYDDIAIVFDVVKQHTFSKDYTKTGYAVESKARASDHVVTQDGKFTFSGMVTDSPLTVDKRNMIDVDTDDKDPISSKRPGKALKILQDLADSHTAISLVTEDNILTNYVITSLSAERTAEGGASLTFSITLEEFRFVKIGKTVIARANPKKAGAANTGAKQTADGGSVDEDAKGQRKTPYLSKKSATAERLENAAVGTTDFSGKPGQKLEFNPNSLMRK